MDIEPGKLLSNINYPDDLKQYDRKELSEISKELRDYIIDIVSVYGGHFGASLGVVELTVALHYVFNTPYDRIVWDVGHQAYGHKILTGRRHLFPTNRQWQGLSGFPKIGESEYDTFGVGHASTSISSALGMAIASRQKGEPDRQHLAVIGDGAMTAGLSFEGLNHAGVEDANLTVILNDNCMSIDPNVGALKEYLTDITASQTYNRFRDEVWNLLGRIRKFGPKAQELASQMEQSVKSLLLRHANFFESLNFRYFGPVDGHDVNHLVDLMEDMKDIPGPKILHCVTVKGKGFKPAEKEQIKWHNPGYFDKITGEIKKKAPKPNDPPKYQEVFGNTIVELAEQNENIMGITPAMPSGSSLNIMMEKMPDRAVDVGIAEQHSVTVAAGMAAQGMKPFVTIYSTFLQRAYDQLVHDVCIQNLPVVFCIDRAGMVGHDGATHQGAFDIAYSRTLPNIIAAAPMNEPELRNLMYTAQLRDWGPFAIRYPRGKGVTPDWQQPMEAVTIGKGRKMKEGNELAILTYGHPGNFAREAIETLAEQGIDPAHYDMRFVKPIDHELLHEVFQSYNKVLTVEDASVQGGFGSAVLEFMADQGYAKEVKRLGVPDEVIEHGDPGEQQNYCGFDKEGIVKAVSEMIDAETTTQTGKDFYKIQN